MGAKGDAAKAKILSVSRKLFAKSGYSRVTMKEISLAANISRGGLYRHYSSTEEIFSAIIEKDESDALEFLTGAVLEKVPADLMFKTFLKLRIEMLLNPEECIENAITEFAANSEKGKELLIQRAVNSVQILSEMIELGCAAGTFKCSNCKMASTMILWLLEGMCKHNALIPLTQAEKDETVEKILSIISP